ncbi:MAG: proline--tRNA ligase [Cytophagales bacterium]|nr:proline--tRNA ligase [Cytophagales bacterium]
MARLIRQEDNFSEWYNQVIRLADLIDDSDVRGCVILRPYGYAIWENIQKILDQKFKDVGIHNAYFPLFIPKSYFSREASHVSGFAKECAIVTHYRLKDSPDGVVVDGSATLDDEYIVRPTSETIIWSAFKKWIRSYRDVPLKINQWCNVCRWEMRTRPFLRTSEFLWQEGHTAHMTREEAYTQAMQMYNIYESFGRDHLALSFVRGCKTEAEKFAGAEKTFTLEALMKDGKALQCATAHLLGQNFAKSFEVQALTKDNTMQYVYGTSWGISTRIIGALVMTHGDSKGLILPPQIAPTQVVFIPIMKNDDCKDDIMTYINAIGQEVMSCGVRAVVDNREEKTAGFKYNEWEVKGVPLQIRIGLKDVASHSTEIARRDNGEKHNIPREQICGFVKEQLAIIQKDLYSQTLRFRQEHTYVVNNDNDFVERLKNKDGFVVYHYSPEQEKRIKDLTGATVRCQEMGPSGKVIDDSTAIYAQSY